MNIGDIEVFRMIDISGLEMYQLDALLFKDWSCLPGAVSTPNNQDALASLNSNVILTPCDKLDKNKKNSLTTEDGKGKVIRPLFTKKLLCLSYLHERKVHPSKGNWGRVRSRYTKHLVSLWKELTPAEKSPYVDAAKIDKVRFLTEKENY